MPKETFFNLPTKKRELFVETALKEFALHSYEIASISNVIREMGIAKGSLYQYFGNKKELYFYLLEEATQKKLKATQAYVSSNGSSDFFTWFRDSQVESLLFDLTNPVEGLLLQNVSREVHNAEIGNLALASKQEAISSYKNVLKQHYHAGSLGTKPNYIALSFVLVQTSLGLLDLMEMQLDFSMRALVQENRKLEFDSNEVKKIVKKIVKNIQLNFA